MVPEDKDLSHIIVAGFLAGIGLTLVMIGILPSLLHAVMM
jgi:hypothetical protein